MPWRVMTYKFINTFIDDLFAFIIPMPTLHRLACFRDDIIFFVFLYQLYLYPVDKTRRNEFGQSAQNTEDAEKVRQSIPFQMAYMIISYGIKLVGRLTFC